MKYTAGRSTSAGSNSFASSNVNISTRDVGLEQNRSPDSQSRGNSHFAPGSPVSPLLRPEEDDNGLPPTRAPHIEKFKSHPSVTYPDGQDAECNNTPTWLPWTLRWYLSLIPIAVSLILSAVVSVLCWYSRSHSGLGRDDDSSAILFGWRFTPTIIVVLYCQLTLMIFEDVKRTEPFARMAKPGGANAASTILQSPLSWWESLIHAFGRKKKGVPRSCALLFATVTYMVGFLTLSPLSSSLLTSEDVIIKRNVPFTLMAPSTDVTLTLQPSRDTYFRTIGNFLQNVSTSAWIGNIYYAHPFWPDSIDRVPLGPRLSSSTGIWTAETYAFSTEFQCEPLELVDAGANIRIYPRDIGGPGNVTTLWFSANSSSGCGYSLEMETSSNYALGGGLVWAPLSDLAPVNINYTTFWHTGQVQHNISANCRNKELFLALSPSMTTIQVPANNSWGYEWKDIPVSNFTFQAYTCESAYYVARLPVTMRTSTSNSSMEINNEVFRQKRAQIPLNMLNVAALQNLSMAQEWGNYIYDALGWDPAKHNPAQAEGLGKVLASLHDFDTWNMPQSGQLVEEARRLKQRFLGELLQRSLLRSPAAQTQAAVGEVIVMERRVVVVLEVGILMAALLFVSFLLLSLAFWFSRPRQRPLHLSVDPSTPLGLGSLVANNRDVLNALERLDHSSKRERKSILLNKRYTLSNGCIHETNVSNLTGQPKKKRESSDWRPKAMHLKTLTALVVSLGSLVAGLLALKQYADRAELYQTFFVYQASIPIFNKQISTIAPYSIIPTILAVAVGLWWDSLDKSFRLLQPYLSMSKTTPNLAEGAGLQYQTSYWAWASFRAARNKHWLLLAVTLGSALSQVFVVSMSALFEREPGISLRALPVNRTLELRQIPRMDTVGNVPVIHNYPRARIMALAFMNSTSNWMYTATIQLTLNGPEPAWSRQGWSFVPVDLSGFSNLTSSTLQRVGELSDENVGFEPPVSFKNVSIQTSGIRARVECTRSSFISNITSWLTEIDLTNGTIWNVTGNPKDQQQGYELSLRMFPDGPHGTSALSHPSEPFCCVNGTARNPNARDSAIGYWSRNDMGLFPAGEGNFTSKWIYGPARQDLYKRFNNQSLPGPMIFTKMPKLQALNCMPIVESADVDVTVDQRTGQVYSYSLRGQPEVAREAWRDVFQQRLNVSRINSTEYMDQNYTTSYGVYFLSTLLGAAQLGNLILPEHTYLLPYYAEDKLLNDNVYNVRDNGKGLNLDFMSYSMYTLANEDPKALLDEKTLLNLTQRVFTTYFQHYVSSNYSLSEGGLAYQKIGQQLHTDLPLRLLPTNKSEIGGFWRNVNDPMPVYRDLHTNRTAMATVSTRIEVLRMNAVATWLSVGILIWLMLTTLLVAALQRQYLGSLIRTFEAPIDVLVAIAASDNLLDLIQQHHGNIAALRKNRDVRARLGWFRDRSGRKRWGIELVGGPGAVRWMDWPGDGDGRADTMSSTGTWLDRLKSRTKSFGL